MTMTQDDYPDFIAKLNEVATIYDKPIEPAKAKAYWTALSSISIQQFMQAIDMHTINPKTGQFFPKPADVMKNARPGLNSRETTNETAAQKWLAKKRKEVGTGIPVYSVIQVQQAEALL